MRHSLKHIRQSNQQTKLKWLIGLSSIAILIVVIMWIMYMQAFIFITPTTATAREDMSVGFWPVFKNGLAITGASVSRTFDSLFSTIPTFGRRTTTIENPN